METFPIDQLISLLTQAYSYFYIAPAQYYDTILEAASLQAVVNRLYLPAKCCINAPIMLYYYKQIASFVLYYQHSQRPFHKEVLQLQG